MSHIPTLYGTHEMIPIERQHHWSAPLDALSDFRKAWSYSDSNRARDHANRVLSQLKDHQAGQKLFQIETADTFIDYHDHSGHLDLYRQRYRALQAELAQLPHLPKLYSTVMTRIETETTWMTAYEETGVAEWIRHGFPEHGVLPQARNCVVSWQEHPSGGSHVSVRKGHSVEAILNLALRPKRADTLAWLAVFGQWSKGITDVQHEALHALHTPIWWHVWERTPSQALAEVQSYRGASRSGDLMNEHDLKTYIKTISYDQYTDQQIPNVPKGVLYAHIDDEELTTAITEEDTLLALGQSHQDIARLLKKNGPQWDKRTQTHPVLSETIKQLCFSKNISPTDLPDLRGWYWQCMKIQRLGGQYIARQEIIKTLEKK